MSTPIQVENVETYDDRRVTVHLTGGPVQPKSYSKRQYRATRLTITYRRREGGPWEAGYPVLSGPFVKKDGTDSAGVTSETLFGSANSPAWVTEMVERYMPEVSA